MDRQERTIARHRIDLMRILTMLWTMAGLGTKKSIPRSLHRIVARLLRPAEAAARRLIVVLARGIVIALRPYRPAPLRPDRIARPTDRMPFALAEPMPRLLVGGDEPRAFPGIFARGDTEIGTARLAMRLDAALSALDDLDAAARRLARWQALRKRARTRGAFCATQPLRLGSPPDLRGQARRRLKKHELHDILMQTHELARWAQIRPDDTS